MKEYFILMTNHPQAGMVPVILYDAAGNMYPSHSQRFDTIQDLEAALEESAYAIPRVTAKFSTEPRHFATSSRQHLMVMKCYDYNKAATM